MQELWDWLVRAFKWLWENRLWVFDGWGIAAIGAIATGTGLLIKWLWNRRRRLQESRQLTLPAPAKLPAIKYRGFRVTRIPLDFDNNNLGEEHFNERNLNQYQAVVKVLLLRFYYKPEADVPNSIEIQAHIFYDTQRSI